MTGKVPKYTLSSLLICEAKRICDRGTLDVSDQLEDGEIRGYFQPYEQPTPMPEPAPEPDPESENAENAEEPPTE